MRQSMVITALCGVLAVACIGAGALFFWERPTVIKVAVPVGNRGDFGLLTAAGKVVRHEQHPIRFKIVPVDDPKAAAANLDNGQVDMAVVRTDGPMPAQGQTVVILHRDAAVLVAPAPFDVKGVGELAGHKIGVLDGQSGNRALLDAMLAQYEVGQGDVTVVDLANDEVAAALASKRVDVVLVVGILSDPAMQRVVKIVADAGEGPPVFLPIGDASAMAQRSPAFDTFEVVKGAFRGSPPQPADEFDTLSVTYRLVASTSLSNAIAADVTRFFLSERNALAALEPLANKVEAPPTDKGTVLPVHPGTMAYLDDEEETFLDQYSDFIYLGAMFFGVIASGATAMFSRLNAQSHRAVEKLTCRLIEIMKLVRFSPSLDLVNAFEAEADDIVATALEEGSARSLDERRIGALGLALDQVREAIRDRRILLSDGNAFLEEREMRPKRQILTADG